MSFKSGFISLIGQPNAGKSTLLNSILNSKVSIVSDKAQTTRQSIRGILNDENYQLIFIDTPGIHSPKDDFGRFLNKTSFGSIEGVDVVYFVSDATRFLNKHEREILAKIQNLNPDNVFCLLNKIDEMSSPEIIPILEKLKESYDFKEIIPISAKNQENLDKLIELTLTYIDEGPIYFDPQDLVDYQSDFQIKEIIREKVLFLTQQEVPHLTDVLIENITDDDNIITIDALLIISKSSMKPILIGKQGQMVSKITRLARKDLRKLLNKDVDLQLYIKVEKDWRTKQKAYQNLGYHDE